MTRPAVPPTPRRAMTLSRKKAIHARCEGLCGCGCGKTVPLTGPGVVYDHRIALDLGGPDEDWNVVPLIADPCNKAKTKLDAKLIAKSRRLRKRTDGTRKPRPPIPTRKLTGGGFDTRLRKKMDGTVEVRR